MTSKSEAIVEQLRAWGLTLPGAHRKSPWPDHDDLAVKDKTFAYLPREGKEFSLSVKLPYTGYEALQLPWAKPTAYGLGKSGWVSFNPPPDEIPTLDELKAWLEESYRAQAPKKLVRELDERL
ncbi:MAG TPA: MmcQ/YjbR family DNA-binding protein [Sphingomicrobium sp.]